MARALLEHDIQRAYIIWARGVFHERTQAWNPPPALHPDVVCFSVPNGGNRDGFEAKRLKEEGILPGFPDVGHIYQGRAFLLEFKKPGGRLSTAQIQLHPRLVAAGAFVATVDSLEAAKGRVREWGLVLPGR